MAKSDYDTLEPIAAELRIVEAYVADAIEAIGNFYPDNSREGNPDALRRYADGLVKAAIAFRDSLSTISAE